MRVAIETELDAPRPTAPIVLHESLRALDRLESTIESMLALARHDEHPDLVRRRCPGPPITPTGGDRATPRAAATSRCAPPQPGEVDAAAVGHILDVLLENALVHGAVRSS